MNLFDFRDGRRVHSNSLEVFNRYWKDEEGDTLRYLVFSFIENNPNCTLLDICSFLHRKENSVSGRITELKRARLIVQSGNKQITQNGVTATYSTLRAAS